MNLFFAALGFLTICPSPRRSAVFTDDIGPAAVFFPVIGFLLGLILVVVNSLVEAHALPGLSSVILVGLLALMTGGLHLDGLGDTFDGLGGGTRERALEIMNDSHTGTFGLIAIVLLLLLKIHALESMDADRWRALLAAPILGRWAMVLLAYRSRAAGPGLGSTLIVRLGTKHLVLATLATLVLVAVPLRERALIMMTVIALFSFASRKYFHRRLGGVTGDTFGAVGEVSEAAVLLGLALGAR